MIVVILIHAKLESTCYSSSAEIQNYYTYILLEASNIVYEHHQYTEIRSMGNQTRQSVRICILFEMRRKMLHREHWPLGTPGKWKITTIRSRTQITQSTYNAREQWVRVSARSAHSSTDVIVTKIVLNFTTKRPKSQQMREMKIYLHPYIGWI